MHPSEVRQTALGRRDAAAAAAIAILTFLVFLPALDCGFITLDDQAYVTKNRHVINGLTLDGVRWAFTSYMPFYWHPLTWLSLQLDASLWWPKPRGFLLTNVLLHAANAALLFLALRALTGCYWRSAAVATFFALHPLRVESVAWVTERKDVLSAFFGLLALWGYAVFAKRMSARLFFAVVGAYALSLMAKPMLVTFPVLLLILDWWPLGRLSSLRAAWKVLLEKLPFAALAAASCAITLKGDRDVGIWRGLEGLSLSGRIENATVSYGFYLYKTFWPADLAIFYPHPLLAYNKTDHLPVVAVAAAALVLSAVTCVVIALRKRAPYLLAGWLWYLVAVLPVIGLVQSGAQAHANRFSYIPQLGILWAIVWGVADLAGQRVRAVLAAGAVLAVALALASWHQLSYWHDPVTLWKHSVATTGPNPIALQNLAECVADDEAIAYLKQSIQIDPDGADAGVSADAHIRLGYLYIRAGRLDDAIHEEMEAMRVNPKMEGSYCNLGIIALQRHQYDQAAEYFRQQLACRDSAQGHSNLGAALKYMGNLAEAEAELREAIRLDPDLSSAHSNLGGLLQRVGKLDEAAGEEENAIQLAPDLYEAHYQLGTIEMDRARYARAAECFRTALRLRPESVDALGGLGTALAQVGRLDEALGAMTEVVRRRPQDGPARFNLGKVLEERRELDSAATQYEAATRLAPGFAQAWYDLGRIRARQGKQAEAIASFEQAVARDSRSELYRKALEDARRQ
jgi:tetratricopeptide (TPR) repeat protein